jgi:glutathione S-transferase
MMQSRPMILVGQFDSPYVRRVAVALRYLGFEYQHDTRSIFGDFHALLRISPLGRIPSLVLDDGEVLVDSVSILDWIDQTVGPERALTPVGGPERRRVLRLTAFATGVVDKIGASVYELVVRPEAYRWPEWIGRCEKQGLGALAALGADPWPPTPRLDIAQITAASAVRYVRMARPELLPEGRYPSLDALAARCEEMPEFRATYPADYVLPKGV